jgi:hypothetical protein
MKCHVLRRIFNRAEFKDANPDEEIHKKVLYDEADKKPEGPIDKSYQVACKKYELKAKLNKTEVKMSYEEKKLMNKVMMKIPKYTTDSDISSIEQIESKLYKGKELAAFNTISQQNNYNLTNHIIEFSDKLLKLIQSMVEK